MQFEISSAYLYLAMSIKMHELNYKGYASWLKKQYEKELEHADEFIEFVQKEMLCLH
ncbi:ferritin-like domain-containing protein [endosymbiont 'TC1' of Trimyema compressum]|uniref:ferritin-like domain-containing protein n=1 Tax=endosymbiont 'TC1' of Trimyema compressum TaxID=243899 RepID=UPI000B4C460C